MAIKPRKPSRESFYDVLTAAINDLLDHGFDSTQRVEEWVRKLEAAARSTLVPEVTLNREVRDVLLRTYQRTVDGGMLQRRHAGISAFSLERVKPKLRAELDRRILAAASLIKLNREQSIQRTLQRFAGWATSIPIGGTEVTQRQQTKDDVKRGIAGLPFIERRVVYDQGHKLVSSLNAIVAEDGGAIAGRWRHVMEGGGYQARPEHVARNDVLYLIRDSWAMKAGYIRKGSAPYLDEITAAGEEVGCRCWVSYIYSLRDLPREMLTKKGEDELIYGRIRIAQSAASNYSGAP